MTWTKTSLNNYRTTDGRFVITAGITKKYTIVDMTIEIIAPGVNSRIIGGAHDLKSAKAFVVDFLSR